MRLFYFLDCFFIDSIVLINEYNNFFSYYIKCLKLYIVFYIIWFILDVIVFFICNFSGVCRFWVFLSILKLSIF